MIWHSVDGDFGMQNKACVPGMLITIAERNGEQSPLSVRDTREMLFQLSGDGRFIDGDYVRNVSLKALVIARLKEAEIKEALEIHMPDRMGLAKEWLLCNVVSRTFLATNMSLYYTAFKPNTYVFVPLRKGQKRRLDITVL